MTINKKNLLNNWQLILLIMFIGFAAVCSGIIIAGNIETKNTIDTFYTFNINEKKNHVVEEINGILDEIAFERNNIVLEVKLTFNNKIDDVYRNLLESVHYSKSDPQSRQKLVRRFEAIVQQEEYKYFVFNGKGEFLHSSADNKLITFNAIDSQDKNGTYYIREMLKAKDMPSGIYVEYFEPKNPGNESLKKISYCRYLPEFDIFIGTGSYYDDITALLKKRIFHRLQAYYEDKQDYVFIHSYDSTALVTGRKELVGVKFSDLVDYNGKSIHEKIMSVVTTEGKGFIQYAFIDKNNNQLSEKVSYVCALEDWNAYIGTGFYLDGLKSELEQFNNRYKAYFYNEALFVIVGLIIISLIIFALVQRGAYMQKKYLEQNEIMFEKLFELSGQAIAVVSHSGELLHQNNHSLQLFGNDLESHIAYDHLTLPKIEDSVYVITTVNHTHYIRSKCEKTNFRGYDSNVFIFEDVTAAYLEAHRLEQMAYLDALTKLPNRHALEEDFILLESASTVDHVIGILDIDRFKSVNDTYGHSVGDEVLKTLANVFQKRLRHTDKMYRYGGEEFVVLLDEVSLTTAKKIIEDIDVKFSEATEEEFGFKTTFSCGLVKMLNDDFQPLQNYLQEADELLYKAKNNGRNRTEIKT